MSPYGLACTSSRKIRREGIPTTTKVGNWVLSRMAETAQEMNENYHEKTFFGRLKKKHLKRMDALLADMSYLILIGQ